MRKPGQVLMDSLPLSGLCRPGPERLLLPLPLRASGRGVLLSHFYCLCFAYVWPESTPQPCASGSLVCVPSRGVLPSRLSK